MVTYGKGGWDWSTIYEMPVYLRNFHFREMEAVIKKETARPTTNSQAKPYTPPIVKG